MNEQRPSNEKVGWLIESQMNSARPTWWNGVPEGAGVSFTPDSLLAVRFNRKEDAESVARHMNMVKVTEHVWLNGAAHEPGVHPDLRPDAKPYCRLCGGDHWVGAHDRAAEPPAAHEPPAVRRWDIRPAFGDGVDFLADPAGEWVKWEDVLPHLRTTQPPTEPLCPRPFNGRPDGFTMAQCILAGECGCTVAACEARKAQPPEAIHKDGKFLRGWLQIDRLPGGMMMSNDGPFGPVPAMSSCLVTTSETTAKDWADKGKPVLEFRLSPTKPEEHCGYPGCWISRAPNSTLCAKHTPDETASPHAVSDFLRTLDDDEECLADMRAAGETSVSPNQKCPRCGFVTMNVFDCPTCKNPGTPYGIETKGT